MGNKTNGALTLFVTVRGGIYPPGFKWFSIEKNMYTSPYNFQCLFLMYYNIFGNAKGNNSFIFFLYQPFQMFLEFSQVTFKNIGGHSLCNKLILSLVTTFFFKYIMLKWPIISQLLIKIIFLSFILISLSIHHE